MEELIKRLERVIATGVPDKNGMHPISAETVLEVVKAQLGTDLAKVGTDLISRQAALDAFNYVGEYNLILYQSIKNMPSAEPKIILCKDCKHYWIHKCMDSMPIERCDLEQTFYDPGRDFCSLAERREDG